MSTKITKGGQEIELNEAGDVVSKSVPMSQKKKRVSTRSVKVLKSHGNVIQDAWWKGEGHYEGDVPAQASTTSTKKFPSCHESHPPLPLPNGTQLFGGSCYRPMQKDCEIYIGFDRGMLDGETILPWDSSKLYMLKIRDHDVPDTELVPEFKRLVTWVIEQLKAGARVHTGCIGGHGRTGLFMAAVVAELGETAAIQYVRKHYCKKAVESRSQVNFLVKHYGVVDADPSSDWGGSYKNKWKTEPTTFKDYPSSSLRLSELIGFSTGEPMAAEDSIWGDVLGVDDEEREFKTGKK